jgi:aminoglycoside 3-N-acetyltransferase I
MKQPFDVRVLGQKDAPSLRAMLAMFGHAFGEVATYTTRQPDDEYLERLLSTSTFVAVAAFAGDSVVGGLAAYVLPKFEHALRDLPL